jgi:hypothetical protein
MFWGGRVRLSESSGEGGDGASEDGELEVLRLRKGLRTGGPGGEKDWTRGHTKKDKRNGYGGSSS